MSERTDPFDAVVHAVSRFSRGTDTTAASPVGETQVASSTEDSIVAELYLQSSDLLLADTIRSVPSANIEYDYAIRGSDAAEYLFCRVHDNTFRPFEAALERDHTVADPLLVADHDDSRVYRMLAARSPTVVSTLAELGVQLLDAQSDGLGWLLKVHLPTRDALSVFRSYCERQEITIRVDKLFQPSSGGSIDGVTLSDEQRRTLRLALENGYFEVPRGISQEELAAEIGVSPSAVSQRLRRATRQVLKDCID